MKLRIGDIVCVSDSARKQSQKEFGKLHSKAGIVTDISCHCSPPLVTVKHADGDCVDWHFRSVKPI